MSNTYKYELAGVPHHVDEFQTLALENEDYNLTNKELLDLYVEGDRIYEYDYYYSHIDVIKEDSNPHDSNAVRIDADGRVVGYIKKTEAVEVRELLSDSSARFSLVIHGGNYKYIGEGEVFPGTYGYFADLYITVGDEEPMKASVSSKKNIIGLLIVGIAAALFGLLFLPVAWPLSILLFGVAVFFFVNWIKLRRRN